MRQSEPTAPWARVEWDLVVVGGGNAAVVAAMAANDLGARVLILERAPKYMRGGNTRHTRNIRCAHKADEYNSGDYTCDELWKDLCQVGEGPNDEELAWFTVRESETVHAWMYEHGARWQSPLAGTLHLARTNRFFFGGGKALLNSYYRQIDGRPGITVAYEAKVEQFEFDGLTCKAVVVAYGGALHRVRARGVVCASGGFEANIEWLRRYWGDAVDNYIIRGTPHNDGNILALLYEAHAASAGQEKGFHAIALDARAPKFDGGIATRLDTVPFGVVVNATGNRFYDEGEEVWPKRYAIWGRLIAEQPEQYAVAFWDAKVNHLFLPPMYGVDKSDSIPDLAERMGLDKSAVSRTIDDYNAAVVPGSFDPAVLDGCRTVGLTPDKTHWAQRLDTPPYYAIKMRPGITFTYMGVAVAADARVRLQDGSVFDNVYAAGEMMSGNILSTGYLAGFGMTIGSVWGRQAGTEAARRVL
ncbi:FAD-dependent tricarballylate dehydrogenase TcuA [Actinomadura sp.]|jgi:tricarballylate dehydrogenase|uniref:FAD-dependent tricarballylate dehydrogenase TcuA n=1 Tax=Actinomadura sp. TaxID=1989 RepID=UPI0037CAEB6F